MSHVQIHHHNLKFGLVSERVVNILLLECIIHMASLLCNTVYFGYIKNFGVIYLVHFFYTFPIYFDYIYKTILIKLD